jgi:hypothetical protein
VISCQGTDEDSSTWSAKSPPLHGTGKPSEVNDLSARKKTIYKEFICLEFKDMYSGLPIIPIRRFRPETEEEHSLNLRLVTSVSQSQLRTLVRG